MAYNNGKDKIDEKRITSRSESEHVFKPKERHPSRGRQPMDVSMSLDDLLKDMEHERDITDVTKFDLSENSSFALDKLEANMQIGSTIRTENLPDDFIGSSIQIEDLPLNFNPITFADTFRKSQKTILRNDSTIPKKKEPERKKLVRFESISKLSNLVM